MSERSQEIDKQRRHSIHQGNLQGQGDDTNVQALQALSKIDLPDADDGDLLEVWKSKVNSTANISEEKRMSHEWEKEISLIMELSNKPTKDGLHSSWQGWAHGNSEKAKEPMTPEERAQKEANLQTSNLALTRSEDGFAIKESLRGVSQSLIGDGEAGKRNSGGILGKLGLK